jgi:hypothetical protein
MRRSILASLLLMSVVLLTAANRQETCSTTLEIVDARTGEPLPGVLRIRTAAGKTVDVPELLNRGAGLPDDLPIHDWLALPKTRTVELPRGPITIEAISGIETELGKVEIDLSEHTKKTIRIPLVRFFNRESKKLVAGNTHLHVMKMTRAECDRYLNEIPATDNLDVLFLSYLERAGADQTYISNKYTKADLAKLTKSSGVQFGNGEEHRHNFGGFTQGYGHVMLLNIDKLILPVSIGPGIMKEGTDGLPLSRGISQAKRDGATTIWCHNVFGLESESNWILGKLDALNIYDGGQRAGYNQRFYQLLNTGLKVPFSTGTDWFMYDFNRVYVSLNEALTIKSWLDSLSAGRSFITNGPLFEFKINQHGIGDVVKLNSAERITIVGRVTGRTDFEKAELIHNGNIIGTFESKPTAGHFAAQFKLDKQITEPGWFALRIPAPVRENKQEVVPVNLFGRKLYGHTSPIYIEVDGKSHFNKRSAVAMLKGLRAAQKSISENGKFIDKQAKARVLDVYDDAHEKLEKRLAGD